MTPATPPRSLEHRVAVVTGGSRGIGRAVAARLAGEGASVAIAARTEETADERLPGSIHEAAEEIRETGGKAIAVACDVADERALARLVAATRETFGPADILVNNAALTVPDRRPHAAQAGRPASDPRELLSILNFPLRAYRRAFEVNLFGSYELTRLVLRDMVDLRRGNVVNISSDAAHVPGAGPYGPQVGVPLHAYGNSKAALEHLTQTVAYEMAPFGIAVNAVLPSLPVITPGTVFAAAGRLEETLEMDRFVEAVVRLCCVHPAERTGSVVYSEDLLDEAGQAQGWLGPAYL